MLRVCLILGSGAFFTFLFMVLTWVLHLKIKPIDLSGVQNRIVSSIHGLFCIWFSTTELLQGIEFGVQMSSFQETALNISIGYFIYDAICIYIYGLHDTFMMLHHSLVIFPTLYILTLPNIGAELMCGTLLLEITNPCLHTKNIMKLLNQKDTKIYLIAELVYIFCYVLTRYMIGAPLTYLVLVSDNVYGSIKILYMLFMLLMLKWIIDFVKILRLRLQQYKKRKLEGTHLPWTNPIGRIS